MGSSGNLVSPMDDGGGVRARCIRIKFPSPRRIMARWFSSQGKKKKAMAAGKVRDCDAVGVLNLSEDGNGVGEFSDYPSQTIASGNNELQRREFLFSIGMSCYLLHLIAMGREEIRRIVELRSDLDKFLKCKNDELRRKQQEFVELRNDVEKFLAYHNDELRQKQPEFLFGKQERSETTSDVVDGPESSTDHYYSPQFLETSLSIGRQGSLNHYVFKVGEEDLGGEMDKLEAELQAELELLQIDQDQDISEKSEDSEGLRFRHMCSGPVEEQQGVCPYELERRLHELMEARQEEKIKELEVALEDAKQRLHMKEAQVSRWKDTAYM